MVKIEQLLFVVEIMEVIKPLNLSHVKVYQEFWCL